MGDVATFDRCHTFTQPTRREFIGKRLRHKPFLHYAKVLIFAKAETEQLSHGLSFGT
jgi:hypothetical protein